MNFSLSLDKMLADNSVICLMAPTASGKTALAYELYDTGYFELISVDSALIYQDMNIGTAKPTAEELSRYPHHLVNIIDPTQSYSVANFVQDVQRLIPLIHEKGKIPLLVGGTMMYYMALFEGLSQVPDSDANVRAKVEAWRQTQGIEVLYAYLSQIDPVVATRLNPTDTQRITRAIEVFKQTGKPMSYWQNTPKVALANQPQQQWYGLAVLPDRAWLHQRIAQRLDIMWQSGLVDEVIGLLQNYTLSSDMPSMRCVGYRQVLEFLVVTQHPIIEHLVADDDSVVATVRKQTPKDNSIIVSMACQEMENKALYATRQLAKRQYTWLRKLVQSGSDLALNDKSSPAMITTFTSIKEVKQQFNTLFL